MKKKIKVLSFDPGLTSTGWAYSQYDAATDTFKVLDMGSIDGDAIDTIPEYKQQMRVFSPQIIKLDRLEKEVITLMQDRDIDYVVSENAFMKFKGIHAYTILVLCINILERVAKSILGQPITKLAPTVIKNIISNYGFSDKLAIQDAIMACENIKMPDKMSTVKRLTEHQSDAIAIGYAFVKGNINL